MSRAEYERYYSLLGLKYGAGADEVKKAFRSKIKEAHPDTAATDDQAQAARALIEAYQALKGGPPPEEPRRSARPQPHPRPEGPSPHRPHPSWYTNRPRGERGYAHAGFQDFGREMGRKLWEQIFGHAPPEGWEEELAAEIRRRAEGEAAQQQAREQTARARRQRKGGPTLDEYWDALSDMLWGAEEGQVYGENVRVNEVHYAEREKAREAREREARRRRTATREDNPRPGSLDEAVVYYNRAESLLRDVVARYDNPENLKRKMWVREYLAKLNTVQNLFRDIAARNPVVSQQARNRVNQIRELVMEVRKLL